VSDRVAFRVSYRVGTPGIITFAAQWLAYTLPCRRFADTLADANARLGANVDRYSLIATDSHRLLLAGLPAHNYLIIKNLLAGCPLQIDPQSTTKHNEAQPTSTKLPQPHGVLLAMNGR
jgi:hypothetical protein